MTLDIEEIHRIACASNKEHYIDPSSGLLVFTSVYLIRRPCCGCGCRHCPYPRIGMIDRPAHFLTGDLDELPSEVDILFWSGGKDSYLALLSLQRESTSGIVLLTTYGSNSGTVAHQEVPIETVARQAKCLDLPLLAVPLAGRDADYIEHVSRALKKLKNDGIEIRRLVFGDLHLEHVRAWRDEHLSKLDAELWYPLWKRPYGELIHELENEPCVVRICAIAGDSPCKNVANVGEVFDVHLIKKLEKVCDVFGENGEFHTLVEVWNTKLELEKPK